MHFLSAKSLLPSGGTAFRSAKCANYKPNIAEWCCMGVAPILPKSIGECRRQKEERRGIEEGERGKKGKEKLKKKE